MRGAEFRRYERWKLGEVIVEGDSGREALQVLDASAGGLGLGMQQQVDAGEKIRLRAPTTSVLLLEARHCRTRNDRQFPHWVGAAYIDGDQGMAFHQWLLTQHLAAAGRAAHPGDAELSDKRHDSRVCVGDGAVVGKMDGQGVVVYDIAEGGLALLATRPVPVGREFKLKVLGLPDVRMEVRHCHESDDSPAGKDFRYRVGAAYVRPGAYSSYSARLLDRYIDLLIQSLDDDGVRGLPWNNDEEDDMGTRVPIEDL